MADKQFWKGAVTGVLCASLMLGCGYVGLQKSGRAGSNVLSDVAVTQKIKYLENIIDQNYVITYSNLRISNKTNFLLTLLSSSKSKTSSMCFLSTKLVSPKIYLIEFLIILLFIGLRINSYKIFITSLVDGEKQIGLNKNMTGFATDFPYIYILMVISV